MQPFVDDADFTLYVGDALETLRGLPDESVHMCVSSPPYWGLRSYLDDGHADKRHELGLEPTPDEYVANMVAVFREVRRVLRRDGTCWLNIGDSYASVPGGQAQGANGQMADRSVVKARAQVRDGKASSGMGAPQRPPGVPGLKPKDLVGIPWRLAFALQADGWYLRSDIIWAKPNPMPESVTDRTTKAHEYLFLLTRSARYFYDADAIREPHSPDGRLKTVHDHGTPNSHANYDNVGNGNERWPNGGRNRRSVWEIATEPYPDAHFATFPQALVEPCILAGTSERGCCPECGAPCERETTSGPDPNRPQAKRALEIAKREGLTDAHIKALQACGISDVGKALVTTNGTGRNDPAVQALADEARAVLKGYAREFLIRGVTETTGWRPTCECHEYVGPAYDMTPVACTVLDPFMGSGTTALVARRLGRRSIGIELSEEYARLAAGRLQQLSLLATQATA